MHLRDPILDADPSAPVGQHQRTGEQIDGLKVYGAGTYPVELAVGRTVTLRRITR